MYRLRGVSLGVLTYRADMNNTVLSSGSQEKYKTAPVKIMSGRYKSLLTWVKPASGVLMFSIHPKFQVGIMMGCIRQQNP